MMVRKTKEMGNKLVGTVTYKLDFLIKSTINIHLYLCGVFSLW